MLKYAMEKVGGSVSYNEETGTATAYFDGQHVDYSGEIINGRMIVDSAILSKDFGLTESYILHNAEDEFISADDAAMAFGLMYNRTSCLPNGVEYQAYIYENPNGSFTFADVAEGVDLGNGFRTVYAPSPNPNRTLTDWAHTHGPYPDPNNPAAAADLFTGRNEFYDANGNLSQIIGDGSYSHSLAADGYLFTPGGYFKHLDYTQWPEHVTKWIQDTDPAVRVISTNFPTK